MVREKVCRRTTGASPSKHHGFRSQSRALSPGGSHQVFPVVRSGAADILSIPLFAFPPPRCSKRGSIHPSIWPNQAPIELTAVRQSLPALRLQICNLCRRLLGIFGSNKTTGIVSYKYMKCQCWLGSRFRLQPPSLDRPTSFGREKTSLLIWNPHLSREPTG